MALFTKICGICSGHDLEQVASLGPNAVGFIQWTGSRRYVKPQKVGKWVTPEGMRRVGVFVCPKKEELAFAIQHGRFDTVQVHRISSSWQADKDFFQGIEFWNALKPEEFYSSASCFPFDRFVFDSHDLDTVGGTGKTCDWDKAAQLVRSIQQPVLLAGGLTPDNVAEAIMAVLPAGVDVDSGVEFEPGRKDISKVEDFLAAARGM